MRSTLQTLDESNVAGNKSRRTNRRARSSRQAAAADHSMAAAAASDSENHEPATPNSMGVIREEDVVDLSMSPSPRTGMSTSGRASYSILSPFDIVLRLDK